MICFIITLFALPTSFMEEDQYLAQRLRSGEPEIRTSALASLTAAESPAIISALIALLGDENVNNRIKAAHFLLQQGPACVEALLNALPDHDHKAQYYIVQLLGHIGDPRAVAPLIKLSQESTAPIQYEILEALKKLGDPRAIPAFIHALGHQEETVRNAAAENLLNMRDEAFSALLMALNHQIWMIRRMAAQLLGKLGDVRAIPPLVQALQHPDVILKTEAVRALGALKATSAVPNLISSLKDTDERVQHAAIEVLGGMHDERALPHLMNALKTVNWNQRSSLIEAIAGLGSVAIQPCIDAIDSFNPRVKIGALEVLQHFKDERIVDALSDASSDANLEVRKTIVKTLLVQNHERASEGLVSLLGDSNHSVWADAAKGILALGAKSKPGLEEALTSDQRIVRARASTLLCRAEIHEGAPQPFSLSDTYTPFLLDAFYDDPSYHLYIARMLGQVRGDQLAHAIGLIYQGHSQAPYLLTQLMQAGEWRHLSLLCDKLKHVTKNLDKPDARAVFKTLKDTARMQRKEFSDGFCTTHLARFTKQDHKSGIDYLGCRMCGSTLFGIQAPRVTLVIDAYMAPKLDKYPSMLYVNGLTHPAGVRFDFDRIEIGPCSNDTIREMCMEMGNDTDSFRVKRYPEVSCNIRRGATIGKEVLNLLSNHFSEITYEENI